MECPGTQNHKNPDTRKLKKTATSRDPKICIFRHRGGVVEVTFFIKDHNYLRNRPYGAPGLQNDRPGFKNDRPGLKNDRKLNNFPGKKTRLLKSRKQGDQSKLRNGTVAGYARSALDIYIYIYIYMYIYY